MFTDCTRIRNDRFSVIQAGFFGVVSSISLGFFCISMAGIFWKRKSKKSRKPKSNEDNLHNEKAISRLQNVNYTQMKSSPVNDLQQHLTNDISHGSKKRCFKFISSVQFSSFAVQIECTTVIWNHNKYMHIIRYHS